MPEGRPAIPKDVENAILVECGHRCAVCGTPMPIERAHIIPWRDCKTHNAEDMICLCPSDHDRADKEHWDESVLREYKKRPWVYRQFEFVEPEKGRRVLVQITLHLHIAELPPLAVQVFMSALSAYLGIDPRKLEQVELKPGSVILILRLPAPGAIKLEEAFLAKEPQLMNLLAGFPVSSIRRIRNIPFVIDNQVYRLADVLNDVMEDRPGLSMDSATAYFSVSGYRALRERLGGLRSFRLLLGSLPSEAGDLGLRPSAEALKSNLRIDLEREPYTEDTLRLVEDLIAFLRRGEVGVRLFENGFLHAKAYLFYGDKGSQTSLFDRFLPLIGIVGSSNFTGPGLLTNKELNLAHKTLLDPDEVDDAQARSAAERLVDARASGSIAESNRRILKSEVGARAILDLVEWYDAQWDHARDFKADLIQLLDASKFGALEYTPYDVYLKAIYTYFRDDLNAADLPNTRSAVELSEFQDDAVRKARRILAKYDGVLIGDSVGMGKTWIGKKLLEDYAYHQRMKALVVCPASLRDMWEKELVSATISAQVITQESLGQADGRLDLTQFHDVDVILVDESHNFRSHVTQRYENLSSIIAANRGRGRGGMRTKVILLTATPINNNVFDLYNQIMLFAQNDRTYFAGAGIGDLYKYFMSARQQVQSGQVSAALFNLLEEVVIRRTRTFIRQAYPSATIKGAPVRWPERKLCTVHYDLEATYEGIYDKIVSGIEGLTLATYNLESYKKSGVDRDEFEEGREQALVGIFKTRYLKRLESSIDAFRISIRRALAFTKTFEEFVLANRILDSRSFQKAMQYIAQEDEEDDATPGSMADEFDENKDARAFLEGLPELDTAQYDLRKLHKALQKDIDILDEIWHLIRGISPEKDDKLEELKKLLGEELKGEKVLLFTYYKDTARYLYRELGSEKGVGWRRKAGNPHIRRMDSGAQSKDRVRLIQEFSPKSNGREELVGTEKEVDILISTDVLSEGQNLQDCGVLINYDLHWNPTRMVQRAGRIDRIGSGFETIRINNLFPDAGLERLLGLVENLNRKITQIDATGFLDASVLGEVVHPRNFNTLRRIKEEDGSVIREQEEFIELASSEFMLLQLKNLLAGGAQERLDNLPDGIHSGKYHAGCRVLFFYFVADTDKQQGNRQHYWRYYDMQTGSISDNRYTISSLIACTPDTPRMLGEGDVFAIQEMVVADILESIQRQAAIEAAPKIIDPIQQTISAVLRNQLSNTSLDRHHVRHALQILSRPKIGSDIRKIKGTFEEYALKKDAKVLLDAVLQTEQNEGIAAPAQPRNQPITTSKDLRLICWEYLWS